MENGLRMAYERYRSGEAPADIQVEDVHQPDVSASPPETKSSQEDLPT